MEIYKLNKLLSAYTDNDIDKHISYDDYKDLIDKHISVNKPSFILLLNIKALNKVVYSQNWNLKFNNGQEESIHEIVKSVDPNQINKILEADKKCIEFVNNNLSLTNYAMFQLRFTVSLNKEEPRSYLRNISFINAGVENQKHMLLLTTITDITDLIGIEKDASISIRCTHKKCNDVIMAEKVKNFINKINNTVLSSKKLLTKRERQILEFIATGQTSDAISKKLCISVNTVNTHRQNLIKKFGVTNTTCLLNLL